MKQSLELKLGQRLTMTPQLQQAIRLLQLSAIELHMEVQQALEENPLLEEYEDEADGYEEENGLDESLDSETNSSSSAKDSDTLPDTDIKLTDESLIEDSMPGMDWEEFDLPHAPTRYHNDDDSGFEIDARSSPPTTLRDHLRWQMYMIPFSDTDRKIAEAVIDSIDDDGYLTSSVEEIINLLEDVSDVDSDEVEAVIHQIQNFDPVGVCARDLRECLLLQLRQFQEEESNTLELTRKIITDHLGLLGNRDFSQLKRLLKADTDELQLAIRFIQGFNPRPGSLIQPIQPRYVTPDVIVKKIKGVWQAELHTEVFPELRINRTYKSMIRRGDNSLENKYIQDQLQEARWFIKSLRNRNDTLIKVARVIVERQSDFFERGEEAMKPMVLSHVAEILNMHESTISRATTHKYLLCPRGVFELKFFFSSHVSTSDGGTRSSTAIRSLIKKFIETESPTKPISDSKIAQMLDKQGIRVARRTVAKYRENMNIPPSNQRKALS